MKKIILLLSAIILLSVIHTKLVAGETRNISAFDLTQYQGKVVYLDFWASWCKPCKKSFPWMNQLTRKYADKNFVVVTINLDTDVKAMEQFLEHAPAEFDIFHDPNGSLAEKFQLQGMPTSYLISSEGKVVSRHIGFKTSETDQYQSEIEALF
ncbi:MAG: thiol-disulfide isomerase/thioredoxin [Gammaproteobacteria bacterium]|jgi:thiol-disulfide isomerase/thioredoxin